MTGLFGDLDDPQRLRDGIIDAVRHGIEASRNDASKWIRCIGGSPTSSVSATARRAARSSASW
jgi:hypothetical protein